MRNRERVKFRRKMDARSRDGDRNARDKEAHTPEAGMDSAEAISAEEEKLDKPRT